MSGFEMQLLKIETAPRRSGPAEPGAATRRVGITNRITARDFAAAWARALWALLPPGRPLPAPIETKVITPKRLSVAWCWEFRAVHRGRRPLVPWRWAVAGLVSWFHDRSAEALTRRDRRARPWPDPIGWHALPLKELAP